MTNPAVRIAMVALAVATSLNLTTARADETEEGNWFKSIFSTGEYAAEETYVGEADVERGKRAVRDFDESDTIVRYIATPRISAGVLRIGGEWERFSFGMPEMSLLPDTLQSAALVLGF